jgi:mono/diheme cytochrome c family protein
VVDRLAPMRRRNVTIAVAAAAVLIAGIAAGCGSQGVASPTPQTVVGSVPKSTTPTVKGNPANGKAVFTANGCGSCHTFKAANATGKVGPDLDQLASYAKKAGQPLDQFTSSAITSPPPTYVPPGFPKNVMPTTFGQTIKAQQLADLVAFLTKTS